MTSLPDDCNAVNQSNTNFTNLSSDFTFSIPDVDFTASRYNPSDDTNDPINAPVEALTVEKLTVKQVNGDGVFDVIMRSINVHLKEEFEKGRITGEQYTKAYIELTSLAMNSAVQFLTSKDNAYWQAVLVRSQAKAAQYDAFTSLVRLDIAKAEYGINRTRVEELKAQFALTKMQIGVQNVEYCKGTYELNYVMPAQVNLLNEQREVQRAQTADTLSTGATITGILGRDNMIKDEQLEMIKEQVEGQRAQTLDTRRDGAIVAGSVGKQKDLYSQQITSYKRDAEYKTAKMYLDAWITQKTIDDGLTAPNELTNATVDAVLLKNKQNNDLV